MDGNVETVMAKQQDMQEKIAQDMILIARSLKDHSMAARDIIKSDKEVNYRLVLLLFGFTVELHYSSYARDQQ